MLRRACEQARSWQEAFPDHPLSISVNLACPLDPVAATDLLESQRLRRREPHYPRR